MADQTRCPECHGKGGCYRHSGWIPCAACRGTGNKTSDEAGPAPGGGGLDEARQGGEGPAGSSPAVSADLIDRAVGDRG